MYAVCKILFYYTLYFIFVKGYLYISGIFMNNIQIIQFKVNIIQSGKNEQKSCVP